MPMKEVKDATDRKECEAEVFFEYQSSSISHTPPALLLVLVLVLLVLLSSLLTSFQNLKP
jgi:hypothetical protein